MKEKLNIEAPWYSYQKKIKALFSRDPQIMVEEIIPTPDGDSNYTLNICVRNHEKFLALDRVLPRVKTFGNVSLEIVLYDEENSLDKASRIDIYRTIFDGNPIVKDIKEVLDFTSTTQGFIRFQPEVIQYLDDNIGDYSGLWSGLAQEIAKDVFDQESFGIHFCTAPIDEELG